MTKHPIIAAVLATLILITSALYMDFDAELRSVEISCSDPTFEEVLMRSESEMLSSGYTETIVHRTTAVVWKFAVSYDPSRTMGKRAYLEYGSGDYGQTFSRSDFAPYFLRDLCSSESPRIFLVEGAYEYIVPGQLPVRVEVVDGKLAKLSGELWSSDILYGVDETMQKVFERLQEDSRPEDRADPQDLAILDSEISLEVLNTLPRDPAYQQLGVYEMWNRGYFGQGTTVAILELAGIENDNPVFAGKVIDGFCVMTSDFGQTCPDGQLSQEGSASGERREGDSDHGLAVSYPIIGNPGQGGPGAITPAARAFWLRAEGATSATQLAIQRIIELRDTYNIVAVSMSFTGNYPEWSPRDEHGGNCNLDPVWTIVRSSFQDLREAGIIPFAAAGNVASSNSNLGHIPACFDSVVSVGTLDKSGKIASYVTASEDLEILAPDWVYVVGDNPAAEGSGTSIATPVAAASYALLRSAFPQAAPEQVLGAMKKSGKVVADPFISDKPAVDLLAAAALLESDEAIELLESVVDDIQEISSNGPEGPCALDDIWLTLRLEKSAPLLDLRAQVGCGEQLELWVDNQLVNVGWIGVGDQEVAQFPTSKYSRIELNLNGKPALAITSSTCLDKSFGFGAGSRRVEVRSAKCSVIDDGGVQGLHLKQPRPTEILSFNSN